MGGRWMKMVGAVCVCAAMVATSGCKTGGGGGSGKVLISYSVPAKYNVPENIKQVAVVNFIALQQTERTWGEVAADKLNERLIASGRYRPFERRNLASVVTERDLQNTDLVVSKVKSQLSGVEAIITGSVNAGAQRLTETKQQMDLQGNMRQVTVEYVIIEATVTFRMVDVNSGAIYASTAEAAKYDSRERKGMAAFLSAFGGGGGGKTPAINTKIDELITQCVNQFMAQIASSRVTEEVRLESGKSPLVKSGNYMAREGNWKEAEDFYRQAIAAETPEKQDVGAHFNLGVSLEAQQRFSEALVEYKKAFAMDPNKEYSKAMSRVKAFGAKD